MMSSKVLASFATAVCVVLIASTYLGRDTAAQLTSPPTIELLAADNDQVWVKTAEGGRPEKLLRCRVDTTGKPHKVKCVGTDGPVTDLPF